MNTTQCFYFIEHYERLRDKLQDIIQQQYVLNHPQLVTDLCEDLDEQVIADPFETRTHEEWRWHRQVIWVHAVVTEQVLEIMDRGRFPEAYRCLEELKALLDQLEGVITVDYGKQEP